MLVIIQQKE